MTITSSENLGHNDSPKQLSLRRELGLVGAVCLTTGIMIGSGIFMSPQSVLYNMGSPGASLVVWALCGVLAMLGALAYAELGTIIKESGGEYIYLYHTVGELVAFVYVYTCVLVLIPTGIAGISLSFGEYVAAPFYTDCTPPPLVVKTAAAFGIIGLGLVNSMNVRAALSIQNLFTAAKVLALVVIGIGGVVLFSTGAQSDSLQNGFQGTNLGINSIGVALYQGFWSYSGWKNVNFVTEELKHPEVNLPRAVMIAIPMVTVLYLLVNVSYLAAMTPREMMSSSAVAVTWGNKVLGSWGWIMSIAAALSAFGSLNGAFFTSGRIAFVAAREGHMPNILAMAHVRRLTPFPSLIITIISSLVVLSLGDFQSIVNYFSFTAWFINGVTISGLLYLKIKKPELPRPYKVHIIIPILVLLCAVFLVLAPFVDQPQIEYLYVILFILSGALVYVPFVHFKLCPGLLDKLTVFLQLFLEVAPADKNL
ncbi:hypothetical protein GJAV_G00010190 [Gymnothorax javanicus]|nr:hypothetical protein GJAV_G00010190 [Gymnothorax javanicus]